MRLIAFLVTLLFITETLGHSYLTSPLSRSDQTQTTTGCRGPACLGPCDVPLAQAGQVPVVTIARGQTINPQWPRNNHAGGFIRFSWTQTANSDNPTDFDNGVQEIHCHEIGGCKPDDPTNPNGGDSAPADGSFQPCQVNIVVPSYLTDGLWTLQWAWFGGAFALGDYYSCVDFKVSGGTAVSAKKPAVYIGGDYSNPTTDVCKFFNTDRLHQCVDEPCSNPIYTLDAQQTGPAFGFSSSSGTTPSTPPSTPPSQSPSPSPMPVTTKAKSTPSPPPTSVTTKAKATPSPSPTPNPPSNPPTPTPNPPNPSPTPSGTPTGNNCVLGYELCDSTTTFISCYRVTASTVGWSPSRPCQAGLVCKPWMEHYVICDRP